MKNYPENLFSFAGRGALSLGEHTFEQCPEFQQERSKVLLLRWRGAAREKPH